MHSFPLYRRVHEISVIDDDGWIPLLHSERGVNMELTESTPIFLSKEVFADQRRQHFVGIGLNGINGVDSKSISMVHFAYASSAFFVSFALS